MEEIYKEIANVLIFLDSRSYLMNEFDDHEVNFMLGVIWYWHPKDSHKKEVIELFLELKKDAFLYWENKYNKTPILLSELWNKYETNTTFQEIIFIN